MKLSIVEVGPTEATVLALLDFLIDPLLPSKFVSRDQPPSQEELVAKQSQRIRLNQDEIALCERKVDLILKGSEDNIDVKINSVMDGCNELFLRSGATENKTALHSEDPDLPPPSKRKRLSEANLSSHDPCGVVTSLVSL